MKATSRGAALAVALLAASAAPPAGADVVILRNGAALEGEVVEDTDERVTLVMEGGRVSFEKRLVHSITKEPKKAPEAAKPAPALPPGFVAPAAPAAPGAPGAPAQPGASDTAGGIPAAAHDWCILWSPEKRTGWLESQARADGKGATFEVAISLLGPDGKVETTRRLVEQAGPALEPRSLFYMEEGPVRHLTRTATVRDGRLSVETVLEGEKSEEDFPLPPDFHTPQAARALVLRTFGRGGAWKGTIYDAREGRFQRLAIRVARLERGTRDGKALDVAVLVRERDGVVEEERVTADGRVLSADLDGPRLTAVGTTKERLDAYRSGPMPGETEEERRARTAFVSPEEGFRILKPGASWEFLPAEGRGDGRRLLVRDALGVVSVAVESRGLREGEDPPPAALGADLVERLRAEHGDFRRVEDGFAQCAGLAAFRLVADVKVNGDPARLLAFTFAHRGRAWTLLATAPRGQWEEARPYMERVLGSFEWL